MNKDNKQYRILIVGRVAWTINESTLKGIFQDYPAENLAYICIETRDPDFTLCHRHFQISEVAMMRKLFNKNTRTGSSVEIDKREININYEKKEKSILAQVRSHRSMYLLLLRELLWRTNNWKSKELDCFIKDFNPDVVFCMGDPLPLMNKLQRYVIKKTKKPGIIFMMDDIWSYANCHGLIQYFYRSLLRKQVKPLIKMCKWHFAISPKMKREYDDVFNIDCKLLTKGIALSYKGQNKELNTPITLVYTGNLLYGRFNTIASIVNTILSINSKEGRNIAVLKIYTQTVLKEDDYNEINILGVSEVLKPVPYTELPKIYEIADVLLFVESLEDRYKNIARLSFSTKLTDYMESGKCIFAVGDSHIAPIEYLNEAEIAVVCTSGEEIPSKLYNLLNNPSEIKRMAERSFEYGCKYHGNNVMKSRLLKSFEEVCDIS